eukprot:CAMPEP_0114253188 /NCGR_PEP_ID=MMETSP0058-20121206/16252_1 /TAXON_ID=36894 /ORGANISM="Pyramimonas parkeae, CCMP726" /LENGTH=839 /DNA_ID=CAMNT_0001367203 /DNA_START=148 /DNA_END=2664 /DNA_ORIENTATION=+
MGKRLENGEGSNNVIVEVPRPKALDVSVLKDIGAKMGERVRSARDEWELNLRRGVGPLQQVRAVLPPAARTMADYRGHRGSRKSDGALAAIGTDSFVPWRGWDELETSITQLRRQGEASLRGVTTALGIEPPPPGAPWRTVFARTAAGVNVTNPLARGSSDETLMDSLKKVLGEKVHLARPATSKSQGRPVFRQRSASESDLVAMGISAEDPSLHKPSDPELLTANPTRKKKKKGSQSSNTMSGKSDTGFLASASLDKNMDSLAEATHSSCSDSLSNTERKFMAENKLADFWRDFQKTMKQNGEVAQALVQTILKDMHKKMTAAEIAEEETEEAGEVALESGKRAGLGKGPSPCKEQMQARRGAASGKEVLPHSIRDEGRSFAIVTTASLPWMTGTSVNPLLRAAYLSQEISRKVTLVVPFLPHTDQQKLFPGGQVFDTPEELAVFIKGWVSKRVGFTPGDNFNISFYPGRYSPRYGCVFSVGDITKYIPDKESDVAVLEEPEHLNWFHNGMRWTEKFKHVVGVVHTNYLEYAKREEGGEAKEVFMRTVNSLMCRLHCHKVVKLSGAVQDLPRSMTEFVHGVSPHFLAVGDRLASGAAAESASHPPRSLRRGGKSNPRFTKGAYFIGKVLWPKGYTELVDLVHQHQTAKKECGATTGAMEVDVYGGGEDLPSVKQAAEQKQLHMNFMGPKDHAHDDIHKYKVFVNPSLSDVVATTTAEALAMGKFVVVAKHPSNEFFSTFDNCFVYETKEQFIECIDKALASEPKPLSKDERYRLTWEAATERFLDIAEVPEKPLTQSTQAVDMLGHMLYNQMTGSENIRNGVGFGNSLETVTGDLSEW